MNEGNTVDPDSDDLEPNQAELNELELEELRRAGLDACEPVEPKKRDHA